QSSVKPHLPGSTERYPGDRVPVGSIAAYYIENFIPTANNGPNERVDIGTGFTDVDQFTIRIDHRLSGRDNLSGSVFYDTEQTRAPAGGAAIRIDDTTTKSWNAVGTYTRSLSARWSTQFVVAANHLTTGLLFQNE